MTKVRIAGLIGLLWAMLAFAQETKVGSTSDATHTQTGTQIPTLPAFRIDIDLVLLTATVTDPGNRYVNGLTKDDFRVWEDKIEQPIEYFSSESVPLSAGIIFDVSGSMQNKLTAARTAATTFLNMGDRDDEYFLIQFSNSPQLVQEFTTDITKLQSRLVFTAAKGKTSLYDALYLGLERVNRGSNARKALLLITDGQDNYSRYSLEDVKNFAKEHDVMIYSIGIEDSNEMELSGLNGRYILEDLAELTGGAAFFPRDLNELPQICEQIGLDLKRQYLLGYHSQNLAKDGRWRKIRVKVSRPKGQSAVSVRAKSGYYASAAAKAMK